MGIDKMYIPSVLQCHWLIEGDEYEALKALPHSKHINSPSFCFEADGLAVDFHFRFYAQFSKSDPRCAIFLAIDKFRRFADNTKRLSVEADIKCSKDREFRQLLQMHVVPNQDIEYNICGFQTFDRDELYCNDSSDWQFAVKMSMEQHPVDEEEQHLMDLSHFFNV